MSTIIKIKMNNGDTFRTNYKNIGQLQSDIENNVGVMINGLVEIAVEKKHKTYINPVNISSIEVDED
jgi:hypothetical protein